MAFNPNVQFRLQADYEVLENGVRFHFVSPNPGPGLNSDYYVFFSGAEWSSISNQNQLDSEFTTRLTRLARLADVKARADGLLAKTFTVA